MSETPKVGQIKVWWIPQVPGKAFEFFVPNVQIGAMFEKVLADYDAFQFENRIKPDYCNVGGLCEWVEDADGEGNPGWNDVERED